MTHSARWTPRSRPLVVVLFLLALPVAGPVTAPAVSAPAPGAPHATVAAAAVPVVTPRVTSDLPPKRRWLRRVRTALTGSRARLQRVAARTGSRAGALALTLDIDNTSLATAYDPGQPVRPVRRLARAAARHDIAVLFNTGRREERLSGIAADLATAGFPIDGLCGRRVGEPLVDGKLRCRAEYAAAGYRIVANVGNRATDLAGDGYGRGYRLPDYGGRLA